MIGLGCSILFEKVLKRTLFLNSLLSINLEQVK
jgi:hypothetical protein